MRPLARPLLLAGFVALAAFDAFVACSSGSSAPVTNVTNDAGGGGPGPDQPTGAPCNPAIPSPCTPSVNPCVATTCDPASKTCVENATGSEGCDGVPADASDDASELVSASCTSPADCDGGQVCGFLPFEGCSAAGACVTATVLDGGPLACSCDGVNVPYVTSALASAPVSSASPCVDAGDAGAEAGADAAADAADAG